MSRVYPSIQGVPFRKVVSCTHIGQGIYREKLECGHTNAVYDVRDIGASKRRCRSCKFEKDRKEAE